MKVVNFVLGLGTAIILVSLIALGIQAFYLPPQPPTFPNTPVAPIQQCADSDTQCIAQENAAAAAQSAANNQFNQEERSFASQIRVYDRNLFIIANIIGVIVFAIGFWLLFATSIVAQSVPIGIMIAGLCSIIYGYGQGWGSVNNQLKFFIGLVIAALVIGGSIWLVQRYAKRRGTAQ